MNWLFRLGIAIFLAGLLPGVAATAGVPLSTPLLRQASNSGWVQLEVMGGRIVRIGSRMANINSDAASTSRTETLAIRTTNTEYSMTYEYSTSEDEFTLKILDGDRLEIHRCGKGDAKITSVRFSQIPGERTSLTVGEGNSAEVYDAPTLWHLLIANPDECREHLIPLLELLHEGWNLAETAKAMEKELLAAAGTGLLADLEHWDMLIEQLADERFSTRESADLELRKIGPVVLGYLRRLEFDRLDAEQQLRVHRIIQTLSLQLEGDTAEGFAQQLAGDVEIWMSLLSRDDESTRRLAARNVEALLGEPIRFDPAGDEENRRAEIKQLRARVGNTNTVWRD